MAVSLANRGKGLMQSHTWEGLERAAMVLVCHADLDVTEAVEDVELGETDAEGNRSMSHNNNNNS